MQASTIVVTGGTKGLGREISLAFARRGHRVVALYRTDHAAAHALESDCALGGLACRAIHHDITEEADPSGTWSAPEIADAASLVLIHNACAAFEPRPLHTLTWDDYQASMNVALKGGMICTLALLRRMIAAKRGHIVTLLSTALRDVPPRGFAAYAAAKAALRSFTLSLAHEYSSRGIKVFSVSPGFMDTPLTAEWNPQLRSAIRAAGATTDPPTAARVLADLVENETTPGEGEDYAL